MLETVARMVAEMQAGELLAIRERGFIVRCVEGALWLTRDDDGRDTVLTPGESFEVTQRGRVLIQALSVSRLWLERRARACGLVRLLLRLGGS